MRRLHLLLCCLAPALLACGGVSPPELRIGINPWPGYEHFFLAQELGLYDTTLVRVRVVELSSLSDTRRAFERGQLDAFTGSTIELLKARELSSRRPRLLLVSDYSDGADVVLARPGIPDLRSLRGRRVGIEPGTLNLYLLARALEGAGLALADIELVPVDLPQMPAAFRRGAVDAVVTYPPASLDIAALPGTRTLFSSRDLPGEILGIAAIDSAFLAAEGAAVTALLRGFERARQYALAHPVEADARMAARERISPQAFRAALDHGMRLVALAEQERFLGADGVAAEVLSRTQQILVSVGELRGPQSLDRVLAPEATAAVLGSPPRWSAP